MWPRIDLSLSVMVARSLLPFLEPSGHRACSSVTILLGPYNKKTVDCLAFTSDH